MPGRAVLPGMITYLSVENHMESRLHIKLVFTKFMVVMDILATPFLKFTFVIITGRYRFGNNYFTVSKETPASRKISQMLSA